MPPPVNEVLEKLIAIEAKLDLLLNQNKYWAVCTSCEGKGYTIEYIGEPGQEVRNICTRCAGVGLIESGKML